MARKDPAPTNPEDLNPDAILPPDNEQPSTDAPVEGDPFAETALNDTISGEPEPEGQVHSSEDVAAGGDTAPEDTPAEAPADTPADTPQDTPAEAPKDAPAGEQPVAPVDVPKDTSMDAPPPEEGGTLGIGKGINGIDNPVPGQEAKADEQPPVASEAPAAGSTPTPEPTPAPVEHRVLDHDGDPVPAAVHDGHTIDLATPAVVNDDSGAAPVVAPVGTPTDTSMDAPPPEYGGTLGIGKGINGIDVPVPGAEPKADEQPGPTPEPVSASTGEPVSGDSGPQPGVGDTTPPITTSNDPVAPIVAPVHTPTDTSMDAPPPEYGGTLGIGKGINGIDVPVPGAEPKVDEQPKAEEPKANEQPAGAVDVPGKPSEKVEEQATEVGRARLNWATWEGEMFDLLGDHLDVKDGRHRVDGKPVTAGFDVKANDDCGEGAPFLEMTVGGKKASHGDWVIERSDGTLDVATA